VLPGSRRACPRLSWRGFRQAPHTRRGSPGGPEEPWPVMLSRYPFAVCSRVDPHLIDGAQAYS
jgi:hypothetical protein